MIRLAQGRLYLVIGVIGLLGFLARTACLAGSAPEASPQKEAAASSDEFFFDEPLNDCHLRKELIQFVRSLGHPAGPAAIG